MIFNNFVNLLIFLISITSLFYSCSNEVKIEIVPKKQVFSTEKDKPVTPLPTPQRLRLLPVDMPKQDSLQTNSLVTSSPAEITTRIEEQQTSIPETKQDDTNTTPAPVSGFEKLELKWATPSDWQEDTSKPMRLVSFKGVENSKWECYISVLMSQAGGVEANLKRWASQMGRGDIDSQSISQLPEITILERQCKILDLTGAYVDMQGTTYENYRLLGVVCPLENQTLFVKMTGPEQEVAFQKENFIKLCNSLKINN